MQPAIDQTFEVNRASIMVMNDRRLKTTEANPSFTSTSSSTPPSAEHTSRGPGQRKILRALGLGLITGAADDDPSAIGTYASAGAALGPAFLWTAPVTFPMMVAVVYLSAKLGQVTGRGLFEIIRTNYPRWFLYLVLIGVMIGNTIEAGADIGGMAAALGLLVPGWRSSRRESVGNFVFGAIQQ